MIQLLQSASVEAMSRARTFQARCLQTCDGETAAARLGRRAIRAARSPLAFNQLLSLCLEALAEHGRVGQQRAPLWFLQETPDAREQLNVRRLVFACASHHRSVRNVPTAVAAEERRGSRNVGQNPLALAAHLDDAAALARILWDHPDLPAGPQIRAAMLASVPALQARAEALKRRPSDHAGRHAGLAIAAASGLATLS